MKSAFPLVVFAALAAVPVPAMADGERADGTAWSMVKQARLIEFTGNRELLKESSRLRIWRGELGYTLQIDAAGMPTDCELADKFRRNYVNDKICDLLIKHHSFEPAEDSSGAAVEGRYEGRLNFLEMRDND